MTTAAELGGICEDVFPMRAANELVSLEYVEVVPSEPWMRVVVRLVIWDRDEAGVQSIRDIKEQEVAVLPIDNDVAEARMRVYLGALARVLAGALSHPEVDTLMPHDLFVMTALKLKNAQTEDDFVKALSARSRLGRWLPSAPARVVTAAELAALFRGAFPVASEGARLDFVAIDEAVGCHRVVLQLVAGETKQQAVPLMPIDRSVQPDRLAAYVRALARVMPRVLAHPAIGTRMPADLVDLRVLELAKAQTEDDFVKALSARSRLGSLMAPD